jgi:hypothetical protein
VHRNLSHVAERDVSEYTAPGTEGPFSGERHGDWIDSDDSTADCARMEGRARGITPPQGRWSEEEYLVLTDHRNRLVDSVDKRGDYAEGCVPEYWIVNPQSETITVLRLRADAYEEAGIYRRGDSAASTLLAGFSVNVAAAFDAD